MVLEVITGPMFSGKTEELLRRMRRERIAKKRVILFKPKLDKRYSLKSVNTHYGSALHAVPVKDTAEMIKIINGMDQKPQLIGVDEVQFLDDKFIDFCIKHKSEMDIIVSALNLDFKKEPFKFLNSNRHLGELMVHAQNSSLGAVCTHSDNGKICGREAVYSQRLINGKPAPKDSPLVLVGSVEAYEARCPKHHFLPAALEKYL